MLHFIETVMTILVVAAFGTILILVVLAIVGSIFGFWEEMWGAIKATFSGKKSNPDDWPDPHYRL